MKASLTIAVHGDSGVGKTRLADTAPGPRLFLDAEGGVTFTPSKKIQWNPATDDVPEPGDWETCVVNVVNFQTLQTVYQILDTGDHPFNSVIIDSLTEAQKRCVDALVGTATMQQADWGNLLRKMEALVRSYRDLKIHPVRQLDAVVFVLLSSERGEDEIRIVPHVQGQLRTTLPGFVDMVGYMHTHQNEETGKLGRRLLVQPHGRYVAKDRTDLFGTVIEDPNITTMLQTIRDGVDQD